MASAGELTIARKLSYGVGHVLNDLTASMWFSYLLIYLHRVIGFPNNLSGYMMLIGQIADAISTIFVGFESDRSVNGFFNYGRRKSWHLVGVICVVFSFGFMFNLCPTCENSDLWARFIYYAPFVVIFQFGWAATQISHLSLIPQLSACENERVSLNAIRYAFTVMSNLCVYALAFLFFKFNDEDESDYQISRLDAPKFQYLALIVIGTGVVFQLIFHVGTNEKGLLREEDVDETVDKNEDKLDWIGYLTCSRFYALAVVYMSTRLTVNMTQVYMPMYITDTLELDKSQIALIPFISFISGFCATFPLRYLSKYLGTYITYLIGSFLILCCSILFWYNDIICGSKAITTIIAAVLLGSGSSVILVSSLSLTADLIGKNTGSSAFVFGCMSFIDKLSNGIAVAALQQFSPCPSSSDNIMCNCRHYYHYIMSDLPIACTITAVLALIILYLLKPKRPISKPTLIVHPSEPYGTFNQNEIDPIQVNA